MRLLRKVIASARFANGRLRHGWAPEDTWALCEYLGDIIAESVAHLRDHGCGYACLHNEPFGEHECTPDAWNSVLTRIEFGFRFLRLSEEVLEAQEGANLVLIWARRDAVRDMTFALLRDHWFHLWD